MPATESPGFCEIVSAMRIRIGTDAGHNLRDSLWTSESYNRAMSFDDYKVVLYRQDDGTWVAEIPAIGDCYALMDTREGALTELADVFALIAQEHQDRGVPLPIDTTEIVHA